MHVRPTAILGLLACLTPMFPAQAEEPALNVLWIIGEDLGPELGCYGTPEARTPNLDRLAAEGVRFTHAFTATPVCSTSRSGFMTGMYPVTIGAHNHRSHRADGHALPEGVRLLTDWLRPAGYFTANLRDLTGEASERFFRGTGKTDWNFHYDGAPFDGSRWSELAAHQPFYAQVNFAETHRGAAWNSAHERIATPADPARVVFPPYYPDHPLVRADWAQYLNAVMALDRKVGFLLDELEADGLVESTVVIFFGDHGRAMVRGKQWPYDSGLHVPLIMRWPAGVTPPEGFEPGTVDERLVSILDVAATTLAFCGLAKPAKMQGRVLFGPAAEPARRYVFGSRDRGDETVLSIRTVRDARYRYLRNAMPERPFLQLNRYKEWSYPVLGLMRRLYAQGALDPVQARLLAPHRPAEELYDLDADPYETRNLAESGEHAETLARLRAALDDWLETADDQGRAPEPPEVAAHWEARMEQNYGPRLRERELAAGPALLQGTMAGEVTAESAILQTRLTGQGLGFDGDIPGAPGVGCFEIARSAEFTRAVRTPWQTAAPANDFIVKALVTDLAPGTTYAYRALYGTDAASARPGPTCELTTLPGADASARTSFVVVTGMNYDPFHLGTDRPKARVYTGADKLLGYPALAAILDARPDFFIATGDNVYYDRPAKPGARTVAEMRRKWHEQLVQRRFRDLFARVPTYWEKDDHDHRFNDCDTSGDRAPASDLGIRIFREQVPVVAPGEPDAVTYRTHRVSRELQIWLLEGRDYRSPNAMPDGPEKTLWGAEQRAWLERTLAASDATFKLVISPTPLVGPDDAYKQDNHTNPKGFRHEGRAFLEWAATAGLQRELFFLCGDRHWQYHSIDPTGFEEFSCGALVDANARLGRKPGDPKSTDPDGLIEQPYVSQPASGGFLRVVIEPGDADAPPSVTFEFHDEHGTLLHSVRRTAR